MKFCFRPYLFTIYTKKIVLFGSFSIFVSIYLTLALRMKSCVEGYSEDVKIFLSVGSKLFGVEISYSVYEINSEI